MAGRPFGMNHPDGHLLDRYSLGQITDEGQLSRIEEHLLICDQCQAAVLAIDDLRRTLAEAERRKSAGPKS
jgi:hypothetical protein